MLKSDVEGRSCHFTRVNAREAKQGSRHNPGLASMQHQREKTCGSQLETILPGFQRPARWKGVAALPQNK